MPSIIRGSVMQRSGAVITAHIVNQDGDNITRQNIVSVRYTLFNNTYPNTPTVVPGHEDITLPVQDVIFDTLQNTPGSGKKHNFRHIIPAAALATAINYRIEYLFVPVGGEQFIQPFILDVIQTYSD
jgi:hypothetical protein